MGREFVFNNKIAFVQLMLLLSGCIAITRTNGTLNQTVDNKTYSYKIINDRKLEWTDFTGRPDYTATWASVIYWKVFYTTDSVYTYALPGEDGEGYVEPNLKVWYAIDERSWVKPKYKNDNILNHEQGHLNIAQMCALDFQKTVKLMKPIARFNWKHKIDSTYASILGKCHQIQNMYDVETNHGLNEKKQAIWDKKINELIDKLK
jgi:hypothetical protein